MPNSKQKPAQKSSLPKGTFRLLMLIVAVLVSSYLIIHHFSKSNSESENSANDSTALTEENYQKNPPVFLNSNQQSNYSFINPMLKYTDGISEIKPFKKVIEQYVEQKKKDAVILDASVYFRDLNGGYSFAVNNTLKYNPGSLMKVFTMVSLLKMSISNIGFLNKKVRVPEGTKTNEHLANWVLPGKDYSIMQLMENMILYSDNNATTALHEVLNVKTYYAMLNELGVSVPKIGIGTQNEADDYMPIGDYMKIFRLLYNSSYLNRKLSEYALNLLSRTDFKAGLAANLPSGITVSHKWGKWQVGNYEELHDCGIVYNNGKAYMIGVMTKGKNTLLLSEFIKEITAITYKAISVKIPRMDS